jgi:seryl-tRNA synthetase
LQELLAERNDASKAIGQAKASKDEARAAELMAKVSALKEAIPALEATSKSRTRRSAPLWPACPTCPQGVPQGADENDNVEVKRWGTPRSAEGAKSISTSAPHWVWFRAHRPCRARASSICAARSPG